MMNIQLTAALGLEFRFMHAVNAALMAQGSKLVVTICQVSNSRGTFWPGFLMKVEPTDSESVYGVNCCATPDANELHISLFATEREMQLDLNQLPPGDEGDDLDAENYMANVYEIGDKNIGDDVFADAVKMAVVFLTTGERYTFTGRWDAYPAIKKGIDLSSEKYQEERRKIQAAAGQQND